ncbi:hypothetical protein IEQ34_019828 [Dendrobium chrysotoxum]|uniref:Ubiquitin-like protease family profile domain-containing protein n=1 Tax=Dendrobium chrysotoxum TaxID=161865 RepID=A0AAV7G9N2_DENCH|nr:hypothetical protein IEQ34_019828 [Dendrobium chrysotoxum]
MYVQHFKKVAVRTSSLILLIIIHNNHWILLAGRLKKNVWKFYDSLPKLINREILLAIIKCLYMEMTRSFDSNIRRWSIQGAYECQLGKTSRFTSRNVSYKAKQSSDVTRVSGRISTSLGSWAEFRRYSGVGQSSDVTSGEPSGVPAMFWWSSGGVPVEFRRWSGGVPVEVEEELFPPTLLFSSSLLGFGPLLREMRGYL